MVVLHASSAEGMDTTLASHWIQSAACTLQGSFAIAVLSLVMSQSLALRYYGSRAASDKVFQANRSGLATKDQFKVGLQLVVP